MLLGEWLIKENMTIAHFAGLIETCYNSAWHYAKNRRVPPPKIMRKIYPLTNGEVTPNDFYDFKTIRKRPVA